ncbi:PD-(D/E)XK nuclease family protein [Neobacillus niacini]|uniref:PDDEXK-like family protein n=1 Tax=Neobacillus niacini TaxID=86668 RepID=UPI0021CB463A|nr:PD-(D/E)XK nuclease family protein [Neobacillus niacini]MCM3763822.1 PD-(D/E)XK nuclease family protein [Neobacillus niacini]
MLIKKTFPCDCGWSGEWVTGGFRKQKSLVEIVEDELVAAKQRKTREAWRTVYQKLLGKFLQCLTILKSDLGINLRLVESGVINLVIDDLRMITGFVINNYRLEKLMASVNEFNPFKVLGVKHYEIRHSNVLGWLLSPEENHHLGDFLFKKMVLEVLNLDKNIQRRGLFNVTETSIFLNSFHDLEVEREYTIESYQGSNKKYIDLVMVSHLHKMVVFIENKIYSTEGVNQLKIYYDTIVQKYPGYDILPIYLTLKDEQPSENYYFEYRYLSLYQLLSNLLPLKKEQMSDKVYSFINDYLCNLRELTVKESDHKEVCEELYREYSREVNYIVTCKEGEMNLQYLENKQLYDLIRKYKDISKYIKQHGDVDYFKRTFYQFIDQHPELTYREDRHDVAKGAFCYPKEYQLIQNFNGLTLENWYSDYPCPLIFDRQNNSISLKFEVGRFKDVHLEQRKKFVEFFRENTEFNPNDTDVGQIIRKQLPVKDWKNTEEILQKMNELYGMLRNDQEIIIQAIKDFWE